MQTKRHMKMSIAGALSQSPKAFQQAFDGTCTDENGNVLSVAQVRAWLESEQAQGHLYVPMSSDCVGFDPMKGCPGHIIPESIEQGALVNWSSI